MVEPAGLFSLAGTLALFGWVALLVALFIKRARPGVWPVTQYVIPGLISVAYGLLWWGGRGAYADGGFGSIPEVRVWFANDYLLTAGWLHYLAFDLVYRYVDLPRCRDAPDSSAAGAADVTVDVPVRPVGAAVMVRGARGGAGDRQQGMI